MTYINILYQVNLRFEDLPKIVTFIVLWIIVPFIMLAIFGLAVNLIYRTPDISSRNALPTGMYSPAPVQSDTFNRRVSAHSGFWAGLVLTVIYIVSQLSALRVPNFGVDSFPQFTWGAFAAAATGAAIGFGFLYIVKLLLPTRAIGLMILILSAASTSALYSYVFVETFRSAALFASLGLAFGVLLYRVFFPDN